MAQSYRYIIVGAGVSGASAIAGIRDVDAEGEILLLGNESHRPYNRPPLSKQLWFGKKTVEQIFMKAETADEAAGVVFRPDTTVVSIDPGARTVFDGAGMTYRYEQLLLATGGTPRRLEMLPGGDHPGICYYRTLDDYLAQRALAIPGATATIIGGGFIGSEMAAALATRDVRVTMIFPDPYLVAKVFPEDLGRALTTQYRERGITIIAGDAPTAFAGGGGTFTTQTRNGASLSSSMLLVGVGILPATALAERAGLTVSNGIAVNAYLQTNDSRIYAAGDIAYFPYAALGTRTRVEHWDNAVIQGRQAGRNMAGAHEAYTYMPYFFSDLFEFGYEAVGEVHASLQTYADWRDPLHTGVIYYLKDGMVRGVMLCNVWDKVEDARALIREQRTVGDLAQLRGAIAID